jgi:tetratricopeptide (TPR) repeat protein
MLEDQAWVLIDFGQYQKAQQLLDEGLQIRAKVGRKMDTNYTIPRLKLALLQERADEAADLIQRFYGSVEDAKGFSTDRVRRMQAQGEVALFRGDGKTAISLAQGMADAIHASHFEAYLRGWQILALLLEGQGRLLENDAAGAVPLFQQAIQYQSEGLDPAAPARARAEALLGVAYLDGGDRHKARDSLARAEAILRKHPQLGDFYVRPARTLAARLAQPPDARTTVTAH